MHGMTYGDYLQVPALLELQAPKSEGPEHDEMLFIIIHQVYELWFKQVLHELDRLGDHLHDGTLVKGSHQLTRVLKILKTMVSQLDILETMTPTEFLSFRDFLGQSSGFESWQFREFEFLLGRKDRAHVERFAEGSPERAALERRFAEPSIWARFLAHLDRSGHAIPSEVLNRPAFDSTEANPGVQATLVHIYRTDPDLASFCELLTDMDEGIQEWRYRHVMMVQRTIGTKQGTGGSRGAEYLRSTLFNPVFPDLWEIRAVL